MPNETQEFLEDLNPNPTNDVFTQDLNPEAAAATTDEEPAETAAETANRRERRLAAKLQAERESAIDLAARLEVLTEAQKFRNETTTEEYLKAVERIYGTQTPEAVEATELLKTAIQGAEKRATERALELFREEQQKERDAVAKAEQTLDSMVEDIEDEIGRDMDERTKQGFFALLEKLSPKDRDGNIIEYADHHAVWDELQARKQPQVNRAKDLAARSVSTGSSPRSSVGTDANERWLRENGII